MISFNCFVELFINKCKYEYKYKFKQMHDWPQPPTIEQCINAKPATISATSCGKKEGEESPQHLPIAKEQTIHSNQVFIVVI